MARSLQSMELAGLDEILAHLDRKFAKRSLNVCLGIDGSRVTEKATRTLLSLMSSMKEGSRPVKPQMTCVHVYDPAKPTPRHLAPEKVVEGAKAIIDSSLGEQNSVKYMSCCTDRSEDDGVCSTVMRISDECDTDLLVLGGAGVNERGMYVWFCTQSVRIESSATGVAVIPCFAPDCTVRLTNSVLVHLATRVSLLHTEISSAAFRTGAYDRLTAQSC